MTTHTKTLLWLALLATPLLAIAQVTNIFSNVAEYPVADAPLMDAGAMIAALLLVGAILKHAVPQFPNRFIPLVTMLGGTVGYMLMIEAPWSSGKSWVTSLLVAASATGLHSGIKNTMQGVSERVFTIALVASMFSFALGGCASTPRTVITVTEVVDQAMTTWAREHVAGRTTPEIDARVRAAHEQYRHAAQSALLAYEAYRAGGDETGALKTLRALRAAAYPILEAMHPAAPSQAMKLTHSLNNTTAP